MYRLLKAVPSASGNEITVTGEDKSRFTMSAADFRRSGLPNPENADAYPYELDDERYDALVLCDEKLGALKYLQSYIASYGEKSEKKLAEKARAKGFSRESADLALCVLRDFGVVNELESCRSRIEAYAHDKLYGRYRIRTELYAKGYRRDTIDAALEDRGIDFFEQAKELYRKLTKNGVPDDPKEKKKIADKMTRCGYSYEEIRYAADAYFEED